MKGQGIHSSETLEIFCSSTESCLELALAEPGISAGFPSPAQDFLDNTIDLNKELIRNPSSTFYGRVKGNSMKDAGITDGDLLVIDRSLNPRNGCIAVCFIDGEFTVKRIQKEGNICWLMPANDQYKPIRVSEENNFSVWGIVLHSIKTF